MQPEFAKRLAEAERRLAAAEASAKRLEQEVAALADRQKLAVMTQ